MGRVISPVNVFSKLLYDETLTTRFAHTVESMYKEDGME